MLAHTFCHIRGIGEDTERRLWSTGVTSWDVAVRKPSLRLDWARHIQESMSHYENRNIAYFSENLPSNQHWRLYWDFRDACAFVDIETIGFWSIQHDMITTLILYDGRTIRWYVNGQNLDKFIEDVKPYRLLVTYNGKSFDVPRIERHFNTRLQQAHIDLKHLLGSLGYKGGLKKCERRLGITRRGLSGIDGWIAPPLWNKWHRLKDRKALETLLAYNIQDTLSLHSLVVQAHNRKVEATPFAARYTLPIPSRPKLPFRVDCHTLKRILTGRSN